MHMGRPIATQAQSAFTDGMSAGLLWGAGVAIVAAVVAFAALKNDRRPVAS